MVVRYDARMSALPTDSLKYIQWAHRRQMIVHKLIVGTLRARNQTCHYVYIVARSLELEFTHANYATLDDLTHEQLVLSHTTIGKVREILKEWTPSLTDTSDELLLISLDNLDLYARRMQSRLRDGKRVQSDMIHAVVAERLLFDKNILTGPPPDGDLLPRDQMDVHKLAALPTKIEVSDKITNRWGVHMSRVAAAGDVMSLFDRPPAAADQQESKRTVRVSLPICTDRSTASKEDVRFAIERLKERYIRGEEVGIDSRLPDVCCSLVVES